MAEHHLHRRAAVATRRRTGPTDAVRALVHDRDHGRCVRCAALQGLTIHHRVNRGMGGAREPWINQPHNLLLVCTVCNGWFEDHPREAAAAGWKVRRPADPAAVPVLYVDGRLWTVTTTGDRRCLQTACPKYLPDSQDRK
jgi:5-methylcytosine-specific restriction enzyme A